MDNQKDGHFVIYEVRKIEAVRLNKFLSDAGVCSRREADRLVEQRCVKVNGVLATMGMKVTSDDEIMIHGKPIKVEDEAILIAFNKPIGVVCTTSTKDKDNIVDYINYGKRIYPIGRLDKDSEGLILLTNQGELVDQILRGSHYHEKEYIVEVNKKLTKSFLAGMRKGVPILDTVTRPCVVTPMDDYTFRIILTQGLNRQIRRMCEYFGYRVEKLKRVRIMNITLGNLKSGTYRKVKKEEWEELEQLLKKKSPAKTKKTAEQFEKWEEKRSNGRYQKQEEKKKTGRYQKQEEKKKTGRYQKQEEEKKIGRYQKQGGHKHGEKRAN